MANNIEKMVDEALEIVKDCIGEDKINRIYRPITINSRAKSRWGRCTRGSYGYTIEISERLLGNRVPKDEVMNVIIHEILHSCKEGMSHKGMWKVYADKVNRKYPQYHITRTTSAENFGLQEEQNLIKRQYAIKCTKCGNIHYSSKLSKSIQFPERYRCGCCGGSMVREF